MVLKKNIRESFVSTFHYSDEYVQPDQSMTIGEIIERHIDGSSISNHENEAYDDVNIDSPTRYDMDLTDVPTKYQDGEYFAMLENARRSFVDAGSDPNPNNLSSNEKVSSNSSESVQSDS